MIFFVTFFFFLEKTASKIERSKQVIEEISKNNIEKSSYLNNSNIIHISPNSKKDIYQTWNENEICTKWDGNGTYNFPFLIQNASDLVKFAQKINNGYDSYGKYFQITENIDCKKMIWHPIGNLTHHFRGILNGSNHIIKNINISQTSDFSGLFSYLSDAIICNLNVNCDVNSKGQYNGVIAGQMARVKIENVHINANILSSNYTGGFAGIGKRISMKNVSFRGQIEGNSNIGGLFGSISNLYIEKAFFSGNVKGNDKIGGLFGHITDSIKISNISFIGKIKGLLNAGSVAGFLESIEKPVLIEYTTIFGTIKGKENIGGLFGRVCNTKSYIENCLFSAKVICSSNAGVLIGRSDESKNNFYHFYYNKDKNDDFMNLIGNTLYNDKTKEIKGLNSEEITGNKCFNLMIFDSPHWFVKKTSNKSYAYYPQLACFSSHSDLSLIFENIAQNWNIIQNKKHVKDLQFGDFSYFLSDGKIAISKYNGNKTKVNVPEIINNYSVGIIRSYAFNNKFITSIVLPNSVVKIEYMAFCDCTNLTELVLSSNIEYIGYQFITGCVKLKTLTIPKSLKKIYTDDYYYSRHKLYTFDKSSIEKVVFEEGTINITNYLFTGQIKTLKEVILPDSVQVIGKYAFEKCASLNSFIIPKNSNISVIGQYAFHQCSSLSHIDIPINVSSIGQYAFSRSGLISIDLPHKMKTISYSLFRECLKLQSVNIPENINFIGESSFCNCRLLKNIDIHNITEIYGYAFNGCINLTEIYFPNIEYLGSCIIGGCSLIKKIFIPKSLSQIYDSYSSGPFSYSYIEEFVFEEGITKILNNLLCGPIYNLKEINLPENITSIGKYVFYDLPSLTYIKIPDNIEYIGSYAFSKTNFINIDLPNKLQTIKDHLFSDCRQLKTINIPENVTIIGEKSFSNCQNLTEIILPNQITRIDNLAFFNCTNLTKLILSSNTEYIGYQFISRCLKLKTLTIPKSLNKICSIIPGYKTKTSPFDGSYIEKVIFEEGTVSIVEFLLSNSITLKEVILPNSLINISANIFENCSSLTNINIPESITVIGQYAFAKCTSLKNINIPENNNIYIIENYAFYKCSSLNHIDIPINVSSIGSYAFSETGLISIDLPHKMKTISYSLFQDCLKLQSVNIPENINTIGDSSFYNCRLLKNIDIHNITKIYGYAFNGCVNLTEIYFPNIEYLGSCIIGRCSLIKKIFIPKSLSQIHDSYSSGPFSYSYIEEFIFEEGITKILNNLFCGPIYNLKEINLPENITSIGKTAFYGSTKLTYIKIPDNVDYIGSYAFSNTNFINIDLPNKLQTIKDHLFSDCHQLQSINIPENVTIIGENSFSNCQNLTEIILPNQTTKIDNYAFYNCTNLTKLILSSNIEYIGYRFISGCLKLKTLTIPKTLKNIYLYKGNNNKYYTFEKSSIEKVIFEEGTINITDYLFRGSSNTIKEVFLPESVQIIGKYAFEKCSSIRSIFIPKNSNLSIIGEYAFYRCFSLTHIDIPINLTRIGQRAFYECYNINNLTFPDSLTTIDSYAFYDCHSLKNINIPNSVYYIGSYALCKTNITSINLPVNFKTINDGLFNSCKSLQKVTLFDKITLIGSYSFQNCISLCSLNLYFDITKIYTNAFENCPSLIVRVVPGSFAESYAISNNIRYKYLYEIVSLNVRINNSAISGMKIILKNNIENTENIVTTVSNTDIYRFYGLSLIHSYNLTILNKNGFLISQTSNITLKKNETTLDVTFTNLYSLSMIIYDDTKEIVTDQTIINWYDENGEFLYQGQNLSQIFNGTKLQYEIILNDKLSQKYNNVPLQNYTYIGINEIFITLDPYQQIFITGKIVNKNDEPVYDATLLASQILNTKYSHNELAPISPNGTFSIKLFKAPTKIIISHTKYITKIVELNSFNQNLDIGSIYLTEITGKRIFLDINYIKSVSKNEYPKIQKGFNDYQRLKFNIYDLKMNEIISDFVYQNQYLIFSNSSNFNNLVQINISDELNEFNSISINTTLDDSNVSINLIEKGSIQIEYKISKNANNIVMIYDSNGKLINSYDFRINIISANYLNNGFVFCVSNG